MPSSILHVLNKNYFLINCTLQYVSENCKLIIDVKTQLKKYRTLTLSKWRYNDLLHGDILQLVDNWPLIMTYCYKIVDFL